MLPINNILSQFDATSGEIVGQPLTVRHLEDLRGCFADVGAYDSMLSVENSLLYTVASFEPADGKGDLHYGVGKLMPGKVGDEYFMTKGHLHAWRDAAEIYFGLSGNGEMLLEDEATGECQLAPLKPGQAVYVPGHVAHRTVNTGLTPLTYVGVYPARAGHDYAAIADNNFRCVVVERSGVAAMIPRNELTK